MRQTLEERLKVDVVNGDGCVCASHRWYETFASSCKQLWRIAPSGP